MGFLKEIGVVWPFPFSLDAVGITIRVHRGQDVPVQVLTSLLRRITYFWNSHVGKVEKMSRGPGYATYVLSR